MQNKLTRLLPLLLLLTLLLAACGTTTPPDTAPEDTPPVEDTQPPADDENEEEEEEAPEINGMFWRLVNHDGIARAAFGFSVKNELVADGTVDEEGLVTLSLRAPKQLASLTDDMKAYASDPDVNVIEMDFIYLASPQMWVKSRNLDPEDPNEQYGRLVYADRASTIDMVDIEGINHSYDVTFRKGWNFLRTEMTSVEDTTFSYTTNAYPNLDVEWYIEPTE